jgi:hypothetical protein
MGALQQQGQNMATAEYTPFLNRLAGLTDVGMGASGLQAQAGANFAAGGSNALANIGNAQAAGAIGSGNAWAGAMGNLSGALGYLTPPPQPSASGQQPWWNPSPQPAPAQAWWRG